LGLQSKAGGKLHLRLNTDKRPIANKYREGKLKRTLKKELKGREIASREAIGMAEPNVLPGYYAGFQLRAFAFHLDSLAVLVHCHMWPARQSSRAASAQPTRLETRTKEFSKHASTTVTTLRCAANARHTFWWVHAASSEYKARGQVHQDRACLLRPDRW
jgi:hypothetical protein